MKIKQIKTKLKIRHNYKTGPKVTMIAATTTINDNLIEIKFLHILKYYHTTLFLLSRLVNYL